MNTITISPFSKIAKPQIQFVFDNVTESIKNGSIRAILNNKSGIYVWENKVNGKKYVGSAINLWLRILDYKQTAYCTMNSQTLIVKAFKKYGYESFTLYIVEITNKEKDSLLKAEQSWIDSLTPEYNILKYSHNSIGYKHTQESLLLIKNSIIGKKRDSEVRRKISERQLGEKNSFWRKTHTKEALALIKEKAINRKISNKRGFEVSWTDNLSTQDNINTLQIAESVRKAAIILNTSPRTIRAYNGRLYRGRYSITIK